MRTPTLYLKFGNQISSDQLSAFRGAIVKLVGIQHDAFHNHNNSSSGIKQEFFYRYPLVQYKKWYKHKKCYPSLLFIGKGTEEAHKFLRQPDWSINLNNKSIELKLDGHPDLKMHHLDSASSNIYSIENWIALKQDKLNDYNRLVGLVEKLEFLQDQLVNNIIAFAIGIGWTPKNRVTVEILEFEQTTTKFKKVEMLAFNLVFRTNVTLPPLIGLGKSVAKGFGTINTANKFNNSNKKYSKNEKSYISL